MIPMLTETQKQMFSRFQIGQVVQHFKRELVEDKYCNNAYLYKIMGLAKHTETGEICVVYQALYDGPISFECYVRPLESFCSEVDHNKYRNIKQHFRFEPVLDKCCI